MSAIQKIVKKINALPIRPDKMATIHAVDGNMVDILIDKSNIVIRSVEVIGGTDFIEPGDELPVSWVDGRPVIFSGTNETVTDLDMDGIIDSVISAVSFDANSGGVTLDLFNSHRNTAAAHHSPVTVTNTGSIVLTLLGQNLSASVDPTALAFVPLTRRINTEFGLSGGGTLASDLTLSVNQSVLDHGSIAGLGDDDHTQYYNATRHTLAVHTTLGLVANTRQIISGNGLTGGGDLTADRTLAVGAGTGISVGADTVGLNLAANLTWTGSHIFQSTITARHLLPELTDTYDIGSPTRLWRKGWLSELESVVFSENTISAIGGWFMVTKAQGTLLADILAGTTQIDFGQTMTPDDFIVIRSSDTIATVPKTEYMQVGTLVSGTTYNVTRGVGGISAKDWAAGTVYVVLGNTGDGRIEFQGGVTPRISMILQGATYNAQTENVRIGDLNGMPGFATETYGVYIGDATNYIRFANGSLTIAGLDGSSITNIDGGNITTGSVTTTQLSATAIDGMTITGALVRTSSTNPKVYMDTTGLFALNASGVGIFGLSTIDAKSWAGHTLDIGDLVVGNASNYLKWDASATTLSIAGNGSGLTNISGGNITTGTVTATQLSAIAINGMTITGSIIRTASSGARTEMNYTNLFGLGFGGIGGTNGTTTQWYAKASDGKLYAAGGNIIIDAAGMSLKSDSYSSTSGFDNGNHVAWRNLTGAIRSYISNSIYVDPVSSADVSRLNISAGEDGAQNIYPGMIVMSSWNQSANQLQYTRMTMKDGKIAFSGASWTHLWMEINGPLVVNPSYLMDGDITLNQGDVIGNYGAVSFVVGDGVNVITNGSLARVSVPFDMVATTYAITSPQSVSSGTFSLQYHTGSAWTNIVASRTWSGYTAYGDCIGTEMLYSSTNPHPILFTVTAHGGAKQMTITIRYRKNSSAR